MISPSQLRILREKLPTRYRKIISERLSISPHTVGSIMCGRRQPREDVINDAMRLIAEKEASSQKITEFTSAFLESKAS